MAAPREGLNQERRSYSTNSRYSLQISPLAAQALRALAAQAHQISAGSAQNLFFDPPRKSKSASQDVGKDAGKDVVQARMLAKMLAKLLCTQ